jgi:hypothetical protein
MALLDTIKSKSLTARKAGAAGRADALLLSTLLGEIETLAKAGRGEITDAVVVTIVKKFVKNIDETTAHVADEDRLAALMAERELLSSFLPKQLDEQELGALIELIVEGLEKPNVGDVMRALKVSHAGQYDGALASKLLKARFA